MRWLVLALSLVGAGGCLQIDSPDGSLICSTVPGRACPEGFYCGGDNRCYRGHSPMSCSAVLQCELICLPNGCNDNCLAAATDQATRLWNEAFQCALGYCLAPGNGIPPQCTGPNDPSSACRFCFKSVFDATLGPYGSAHACATQAEACRNDL